MSDRSREILAFFEKKASKADGQEGYISGEQIAKEMGLSRTAVWNHIDTLRKLGYEFEAIPHLGYQLVKSPDRFFPEDIERSLKTKIIGKKIYYYDVTESTNDIAEKLARNGEKEGAIVLAEFQTAGRGRLERKWHSVKSENILLSIILKPELDPSCVSMMTVMISVATANALRSLGYEAKIKWPNDIYIKGKKVAGILTEMKSELDRIQYLVVGIGINVNVSSVNLPEEIKHKTTSLRDEKNEKINRTDVLKTLLVEIEKAYNLVKEGQFETVLAEWSKLSIVFGQWVEVNIGKRTIEGVVIGTDRKGSLLLKMENGFIETVISGDVQLKK